MSTSKLPTIYLVSDGTGRTCETVVQAVLIQFEGERVRLVRKPGVRRPSEITELMKQAAGERAVVFYVGPPAGQPV